MTFLHLFSNLKENLKKNALNSSSQPEIMNSSYLCVTDSFAYINYTIYTKVNNFGVIFSTEDNLKCISNIFTWTLFHLAGLDMKILNS